MERETRALLDHLFDRIDLLSYYDLLGVPQDASVDAVREAFYGRAEIMHPDRHFNIRDTDLREKLATVYKRVAEAYRVLGTAESRKEYDDQLRFGRRRYQPDLRKDIVRDPEADIRNLRARRLFVDARAAMGDANPIGAKMALQMALLLEPKNPVILEALAELERAAGPKPRRGIKL